MNYHERLIMDELLRKEYTSQRQLVKDTQLSLGLINKTINSLIRHDVLDEDMKLRPDKCIDSCVSRPKRAIILAAGYGLRMVPIGSEVPKALLEVRGEILIERQIRHLKEKGIHEIYVVVGYLKEMFDYLVDDFGVHLIYNKDYDTKNNLYTMSLVADKILNAYIIPCDIYAYTNPFGEYEVKSWYMLGKEEVEGSGYKVNRKGVIKRIGSDLPGNRVLGITYLNEEDGLLVRKNIEEMIKEDVWAHSFWEEALFADRNLTIFPRFVDAGEAVEINTYMDLRSIDAESDHLNSSVLDYISRELDCRVQDITEITIMKKGMTNRSFRFTLGERKYIMRLPGEGTEQLINRSGEYMTYQAIKDQDISDKVVAICPEKGYKITEFWPGTRECDPENMEEVAQCMDYLRTFHGLKLKVPHTFNLFHNIDYYEGLWTRNTLYKDYREIKDQVLRLKDFVEKNKEEHVLAHIDAVPDNFLYTHEGIRLIDWEYAGMQDPHVDVAMFAIYSLYDRERIDDLIRLYFKGEPDETTRMKIYAYIAICGLLWSNWCEYKRMLGVEFGEYSIRQYRYAKDYTRIVQEYLDKE